MVTEAQGVVSASNRRSTWVGAGLGFLDGAQVPAELSNHGCPSAQLPVTLIGSDWGWSSGAGTKGWATMVRGRVPGAGGNPAGLARLASWSRRGPAASQGVLLPQECLVPGEGVSLPPSRAGC